MVGAIKIYHYKGCDTCRKALKFLDAEQIDYEKIPIRERPPSPSELRAALKHLGGDLRRLFNTSGRDYRELGLKDKIEAMDTEEAIGLLASNGNLIKRPLVLGKGFGLVGFKEPVWRETFGRTEE